MEPDVEINSTNGAKLTCPRCACVILRENVACMTETPQALVSMKKDRMGEMEDILHYWTVKDMMAFENIGFSKAAGDGLKYLICADCEVGPLGFTDPKSPICYIAASRVTHSTPAKT
ncbi:hypothetical protein HDV03_004587 [Kappamyces sp. JEL0829]|nr:hypothetical protein HDV03_004587 [Kappamyces sp. JEL0829]KAJ3360524.1 hypothetical protein HDU91_004548 [Kappamyces sp. JEL0680]